MTTAKKDEVNVLVSVTRIEGEVKTIAVEVARIGLALVEMAKEQSRKHDENILRIEKNHAENANILAAQQSALLEHKTEDGKNFQQVFQLQDRILFGLKLLAIGWVVFCTIIGGIWAFVQWISPLIRILMNAKGLGD